MGRVKNKRTPACVSDEYSVIMPVKKPAYSRVSDYRKQAIQAAKDLMYGDEVVEVIKNAKDDNMISGIMQLAREEKMEADFKRGKR